MNPCKLPGPLAAVCIALVASSPRAGELGFYQEADREKVSTAERFTVTIVVNDAPVGAKILFRVPAGFEVISRSDSVEWPAQVFPADPEKIQSSKVVMHATRPGKFLLKAAVLTFKSHRYATEAIAIEVVAGPVATQP